jgi:hypothetical protein
LLAVGRFVDFPVSGGAKHSYDRTNALPRKGPAVAAKPVAEPAKRLVVLVSGSGTNLQALLDEIAATGAEAYGAEIVAVGADREGIEGLARAERAGIPTFVCKVKDHGTREEWDLALAEAVAAHRPDLVVSAGFMKIVGKEFLARFPAPTASVTPSRTAPRSPAAPSTSSTTASTPGRSSRRAWSRSGTRTTRALCTSASRKSSEGCSSRSWGGSPATAIALRDER